VSTISNSLANETRLDKINICLFFNRFAAVARQSNMSDAFPEPALPPVPIPKNEARRLEALRRYHILDTPPEAAFDRITSLAARLFDVPIALVSLVDESRAWFKSCYGFELQEVQRDATICSFALLFNDVLVIPDARQDERFACNPFVQAEPGLRFYAGAPLLTQDGFNLGTLCLLDMKPRPALTDEQKATLSDLAAMVVDELELRLAARKVAEIDAALLEVTQSVSGVTGEGFFQALVQHLTKVLGVDYACISVLIGEDQTAVQTVAFCAQGQIVDNIEYSLQDTPCSEVIRQQRLCCYSQGIQAQFPKDTFLVSLGIESYAAIPFFASTGKLLGLLSVMDSKPLANLPLAETLLTIFALRIATEQERQQAEAARQQTQQQLEQLVEQRTAELSKANQHLQLEIAERQQAEAALQKEQNTLKILLDNVQAGIVACNAEGILTLFNRTAREFHGLPEQPLPPDQWAECYDLYMPDGKTPMPKQEIPLFRALQGEAVCNVEMVIAPRRGTARILLASGQAIVDAQGQKQGAVVVMHDITERKQAEAEHAQLIREQAARLEAEAANRMKDEFLAILSHELRTPLNPILGWSTLLQNQTPDPATLTRGLQTIERNARLQTQLIEDLLDVSRILQGKLSLDMAPVDLKAVIQAAMETVQLAAEAKTIQMRFAVKQEAREWISVRGSEFPRSLLPIQVMGDAGRLQQVVWNLLSNAVKFTPNGGQVEIRLERVEADRAAGKVRSSSSPSPSSSLAYAQITVTDTGKGITSDFLPHIFERFRQADSKTTRKFGGLGLGLAIVRQLVELHGGTVYADSAGEGRGATFTVRLPLLKTKGEEIQDDHQSLPVISLPHALRGLRILVVDDETDARELLSFILEQEGAMVTSVASAVEALQALAELEIDILISDIGMPNMDGYMLMQQMQAQFADKSRQVINPLPKAIALTAYAGEINQQKALAAGFQRHLSKPVEPTELVAAILSLVE
jgi:PAS domain S-box-containing protein